MTPLDVRLSPRAARAWRRRWDLQQERHVPDREARFAAITETLATVAGPEPRVLDLGCGTGSLTERVLRRLPRAKVVAVDFDTVTLAIGRAGLGSLGGRLTWVETDLREPHWETALPPGRFDAAVSTTALHWLTGAQLARVYGVLGRRIRRGGIFLNGDFLGFDERSLRLAEADRLARKSGASGRRGRGESWSDWWAAVRREPTLRAEVRLRRSRFPGVHTRVRVPNLAGHVDRLQRAGFSETEVVWSRGQNRVLAAVR